MAKLNKEQVKKIAELARISLSDDELEKFSTQLSAITDYVEQLKEIDADQEISFEDKKALKNVLRPDEPKPSLKPEDVFKNAGEGRSANNYFITSKII